MEKNPREADIKQYEVSCISSLDTALAEMVSALKKRGVTVTEEGKMVPVRLAYPIEKQTSGFFGFARFSSLPVDIAPIEADFKAVPSLLRYLIVTPPPQVVARGGERRGAPKAAPAPTGPALEAPALTNEALEQKLEEILK